MQDIIFAPSGNSDRYRQDGGKSTIQVPKWLSTQGLHGYEVSFGRGVNISQDLAKTLAVEFANYDITVSVHAPYYVNLATVEEDKATNNIRYILDSMDRSTLLGGNRTVFHPGAPKGLARRDAMDIAVRRIDTLLEEIYSRNMNSHKLAIETMGKLGQLGDNDEIIELCAKDTMLYPCIDFGHVNAREDGVLKNSDDFRRLLDKYLEGLGYEKVRDMHVHFSKIEYTDKGEVRHLTFEDTVYGPEFQPMLDVFKEYKLAPYVVCESAGTQSDDALEMQRYWRKINGI